MADIILPLESRSMKFETNTGMIPFFSGTYENMWEVSECDDDGNELEVNYELQDLMKSIVDEYQDHADYIVKEWGIPWITSIHFTGLHSPREYNFSTDELDFTLTINKKLFMDRVKKLADDKKFATFLHEHYTSYDGFMSFTLNNYNELLEQIVTEGREYTQSVSAVIRFLTEDKACNIEQEIFENWLCNGYGGLDYEIVKPEVPEEP